MASEKGFMASDEESTTEPSGFSSEFAEGIAIAFEGWSLSWSLSTATSISCSFSDVSCSFSGLSSSSFLLPPPPANSSEGESCLFSEKSFANNEQLKMPHGIKNEQLPAW